MADYQIATAREDGSWEIIEHFEAEDDGEANGYADYCYDNLEWYVLKDGVNING